MEEYTSPVYKVRAVPVEKVVANSCWKSLSGKTDLLLRVYATIFRRKISMNWLTAITAIW